MPRKTKTHLSESLPVPVQNQLQPPTVPTVPQNIDVRGSLTDLDHHVEAFAELPPGRYTLTFHEPLGTHVISVYWSGTVLTL